MGCLVAVRGLRGSEDPPARELVKQVAAFPILLAAVAMQVAQGTWALSLIILGLRPLGRPGLVEIPLGSRTESGMAASAAHDARTGRRCRAFSPSRPSCWC
jgi:multisubunit Na+/H+ antiporter MnhE subunit